MDTPNHLINHIQIGIDIATSATIIGAFISWIIESRRRQKKEQQYGVNERANATVLKTTQEVLAEFENRFSKLIEYGQKFEKNIDARIRWSEDKPFERIAESIEQNDTFIDARLQELHNFKEEVGKYYEVIQMRRYTLFPLLDALDEGENFIQELSVDIDQIGSVYNMLSGGWSSLLKEYHELLTYMKENHILKSDKSEIDMFTNDVIRGAILSILSDKDYLEWTVTFVPDEEEKAFIERVKSGDIDAELLSPIVLNMLNALSSKPYELYGLILGNASNEVQNARQECKDIVIKLSALMHKLLTNNNEKSLSSIVERYRSEKYFNADKAIR